MRLANKDEVVRIKSLGSKGMSSRQDTEVGSQKDTRQLLLQQFSNLHFDDSIRQFFLFDVAKFEQKLRGLDSQLQVKRHKNINSSRERLLLQKYSEAVTLVGEKLLSQKHDREISKQVKQTFRKEIFHWLSKNPFISRGLQKPRGYPGDYMMMEMGYNREVPKKSFGLSGELDRICYGKYQCIPLRKEKLKELLRNKLEKSEKGKHLKILTLGGGPAREWIELDTEIKDGLNKRRVKLTYLDQDEEAVEFSRQRLKGCHLISDVEYRNESLLTFVKSPKWREHYGEFDLVYILGVGDYLGDSILTNIIVQGLNLIQKRGQFVITQKDKNRFNFMFLDWFCDWTFVKRDEAEFSHLLQEAISKSQGKFECEIIRERSGEIMFGIITRLL